MINDDYIVTREDGTRIVFSIYLSTLLVNTIRLVSPSEALAVAKSVIRILDLQDYAPADTLNADVIRLLVSANLDVQFDDDLRDFAPSGIWRVIYRDVRRRIFGRLVRESWSHVKVKTY